MITTIKNFIAKDYFSGLLLVLTAAAALIIVNSPLQLWYGQLLKQVIAIHIGPYSLSKPFLLWINDGFMALFFLLVGLEIKRQLMEGELNNPSKAALPIIAAIGGMLVPSLIFIAFNAHNSSAMRGWAIPSATDIAFALAMLNLFGKRIPFSVKIFLCALAILDDLGAIVIIALFYSNDLSLISLLLAGLCTLVLVLLNYVNVTRFRYYALIGFILWICVLKSGVHATLAGVVIALCYPLRDQKNKQHDISHKLEQKLMPLVNFVILPLFAFVNSGVPLNRLPGNFLTHTIALGTVTGLVIGKQLGIFTSCWLAIKLKIARLPTGMNWHHLYFAAVLCGIGFTMSLFIGTLAYENVSQQYIEITRGAVLIGSLISALLGATFIGISLKKQREHQVSE